MILYHPSKLTSVELSLLFSIIMTPSSILLLMLLSTIMELNGLKRILLKPLSLLMLELSHLCLREPIQIGLSPVDMTRLVTDSFLTFWLDNM